MPTQPVVKAAAKTANTQNVFGNTNSNRNTVAVIQDGQVVTR